MIIVKMRFGNGSSAVYRQYRYREEKHVKNAIEKSIKKIGGMDMQGCTGIIIEVRS